MMNTTTNTNGSKGSKFNRDMNLADVAKLVRKDIAAEIKAGNLADIKVSVRIKRFSMGQSMTVEVTSVPDWFRIWERDFVAFEIETEGRVCYQRERYTRETRAMLRRLEGIMGAYNRSDCDSMTDHFDVHFYAHAEIDWELQKSDRAKAEAEIKKAA